MTIATLFLALIATPAASGPGEPMLLDFHADWCGPCRQMRPAVVQLVRLGYPVKSVDIDRSPEIRDRYQVEQVPTFIVVDGSGKVLSRTTGDAAGLANSPHSTTRPFPESLARPTSADPPNEREAGRGRPLDPRRAPSRPSLARSTLCPVGRRPVRIKMHVSNSALIFGSGTIIYSSEPKSRSF